MLNFQLFYCFFCCYIFAWSSLQKSLHLAICLRDWIYWHKQ